MPAVLSASSQSWHHRACCNDVGLGAVLRRSWRAWRGSADIGVAFGAAPAAAQWRLAGYGSAAGHVCRGTAHRRSTHAERKAAEQSQQRSRSATSRKGPLQIFVSIDQQKLHLYSDGVHVADTSVATGVPSLPTPLGVFSVIQKQVFHRSNLYSDAPMPFMQRITWSGVALHEGESIGHRASHGCIRMPRDFAVRLYQSHQGSARVSSSPIGNSSRSEFADPHLFVHQRHSAGSRRSAGADFCACTAPRRSQPRLAVRRGKTASNAGAETQTSGCARSRLRWVRAQALTVTSAIAPRRKSPTPHSGRHRDGERRLMQRPCAMPSLLTPNLPTALDVKDALANKTPIAIFISRKEKKIYVRQNFEPLFSAPSPLPIRTSRSARMSLPRWSFSRRSHDAALERRLDARRTAEGRSGRPNDEPRYDQYAAAAWLRSARSRRPIAAAANARAGARPHRNSARYHRLDFPTDRSRFVADRVRSRSRR